jgi:hypothetical protein
MLTSGCRSTRLGAPADLGSHVKTWLISKTGLARSGCFVYQSRVPVDLRELVEAPKSLPVRPEWEAPDSTWFCLNASLDLASGETVQGLELRGGACQSLPDRAVRFQLQHYPTRGQCVPLVRIEWRPLAPHTNPANCASHLQMQRIVGSHIHGFDMNWLTDLDRLRTGNLPVAEALSVDPSSFQDLLVIVGKELRITGLDRIEPPPWRVANLFGI